MTHSPATAEKANCSMPAHTRSLACNSHKRPRRMRLKQERPLEDGSEADESRPSFSADGSLAKERVQHLNSATVQRSHPHAQEGRSDGSRSRWYHERRWVGLADIIQGVSSHAHALADNGGREPRRGAHLKQTACQMQEAARGLVQQQCTGTNSAGGEPNSGWEESGAGRPHQQVELQTVESVLQLGGRCRGRPAQNAPRGGLNRRRRAHRRSIPTQVLPRAQRLAQHICASPCMSTKTGTEARSIIQSTPREMRWRHGEGKSTCSTRHRPTKESRPPFAMSIRCATSWTQWNSELDEVAANGR